MLLPNRRLAVRDHHVHQVLAVAAVQLVLDAVDGGGELRRGTEQVVHLVVVGEAVEEVQHGEDVRDEVHLLLRLRGGTHGYGKEHTTPEGEEE